MDWVCENHPHKKWPDDCECGAGMLASDAIAQTANGLRHLVNEEMGEINAKKYGSLILRAADLLETR